MEYEYFVDPVDTAAPDLGGEKEAKYISKKTSEGWRLISVVSKNSGYSHVYYWERKKQQEKSSLEEEKIKPDYKVKIVEVESSPMAIKVVDKTPSRSVVKKCTCGGCGATLEYTPSAVTYKFYSDYGGGSDRYAEFTCPNCGKFLQICQ